MKKVLFVHMDFYDYDYAIKDGIESLGFSVDMFYDMLKKNLFTRFLSRAFKADFLARYLTRRYQLKYLANRKANNIHYDIVFVIVGRFLSEQFLQTLRFDNENAVFIMYLWDDIARVENFEITKKYFDVFFTIDINDSKKFGYRFLPLFYLPDYFVSENNKKDILLFSSGLDHSERVVFLKRILENNDLETHQVFFHIYSSRFKRFLDRLRNLDFSKKPEFIHYSKLPLQENIDLTKRSIGIVDIQYRSQNGLTMRTFEALASKCKLITTNSSIREYDFYNPNNIHIINRESLDYDISFLATPYEEIPLSIVEKYSLDNWIETIFGDFVSLIKEKK